MNPYEELEPILRAVRAASRAVLHIYQGAFEVQMKEDHSPVTAADLAANAILLEALAIHYPSVPVVSEESLPPELEGNSFFLVDPIDGTSDFVKRRDEFTVNVALVEDGFVRAGIVSAPALDELFCGVVGDGAWAGPLYDGRATLSRLPPRAPFSPRSPGDQTVRVLCSVSHRDPHTDALIAALPKAEPLSVGSSLKFCRLAQGKADYYPRKASLHEWDIAAGHAILKAAGGNVYNAGTLEEVRYGNAGFATPFFEAY